MPLINAWKGENLKISKKRMPYGILRFVTKPHQQLIKLKGKTIMAQKALTYKQYRTADIIIFLVIYLAIEALLASLSVKFTNVNFSFTLCYAVAAIMIMRWGAFSTIHLFLGGALYAAILGGSIESVIGYAVGNLFALIVLLLFKILPKKKITENFSYSLIYLIAVYVLICLGRAILLSIMNGALFVNLFIDMSATEAFSLTITIVIIIVARRQDGVFEDQKEYLSRTEKERKRALQNTTYDEDVF